jgi:hypothetical protein
MSSKAKGKVVARCYVLRCDECASGTHYLGGKSREYASAAAARRVTAPGFRVFRRGKRARHYVLKSKRLGFYVQRLEPTAYANEQRATAHRFATHADAKAKRDAFLIPGNWRIMRRPGAA